MFLYLHKKQKSKTAANPPSLDSALFQWSFLVLITNHKYAIHLAYFTLSSRNSSSKTKTLLSEECQRLYCLFGCCFECRFSGTLDTQNCLTTLGSLGRLLWVFPFVSHALYRYFLPSFIWQTFIKCQLSVKHWKVTENKEGTLSVFYFRKLYLCDECFHRCLSSVYHGIQKGHLTELVGLTKASRKSRWCQSCNLRIRRSLLVEVQGPTGEAEE